MFVGISMPIQNDIYKKLDLLILNHYGIKQILPKKF